MLSVTDTWFALGGRRTGIFLFLNFWLFLLVRLLEGTMMVVAKELFKKQLKCVGGFAFKERKWG